MSAVSIRMEVRYEMPLDNKTVSDEARSDVCVRRSAVAKRLEFGPSIISVSQLHHVLSLFELADQLSKDRSDHQRFTDAIQGM